METPTDTTNNIHTTETISNAHQGPERHRGNSNRSRLARPRNDRATDNSESSIQSSTLNDQVDGPASRPRGNHPGRRGGGAPRTPRSSRGGKPQTSLDVRNQPPAGSLDVKSDSNGASTSRPAMDDPSPCATPGSGAHRRAKFNSSLTEASSSTPSSASAAPKTSRPRRERFPRHNAPSQQDDLAHTLIRTLSTPPYPDCPICFSAIHPAQPIWSCVPSAADLSVISTETSTTDSTPCCYTPFHMKCIRAWASKSVKELSDALQARGEFDPNNPQKRGCWRCPGCQRKREDVPSGYWCFCHSTQSPQLARLATPHSCGNSCARKRPSCSHPCPMLCHPGPCPPCVVREERECWCRKEVVAFKCGSINLGSESALMAGVSRTLSCGKVCGRFLGCGTHRCESVCHPSACSPCERTQSVSCLCGKTERVRACGEGSFECEELCGRPFDCGIHSCQKPCHSQASTSTKTPCPRSPHLITTCPCTKHPLEPSHSSAFSPTANLSRTSCSDPIPTCLESCGRPLSGCDHMCKERCHEGPCRPCSEMIVRPCRCGSITKLVRCADLHGKTELGSEWGDKEAEIICDKSCGALRSCGRHQCTRTCCPLAILSKSKSNRKRPANSSEEADPAGLHTCDFPCGRLLNCGTHRCEERDHRGACAPCMQSRFEEAICACGRTVWDPPIACGTRLECRYPCARDGPECGHPMTVHACHESNGNESGEERGCPPCVFLTSKRCACGKKMVDNVRCSQEKVGCGVACGRLLGCGFHMCEKLCHSGDCGPCSTPCGKSRKLCLPHQHSCTLPCHAPSICSELEPCRATIVLTCPCRRLRSPVSCGRSATNPSGRELPLKCGTECAMAKRNARLADALGINMENKDKEGGVVYKDDLIAFAKVNPKLLGLVENAFQELCASEKKMQVLPHMPPDRRQFVRDLAVVYRIDTQMVDQEPHRSVQLLRRIDSRVPPVLLSYTIATQPSLGKLADLRAPVPQPWRAVVHPPVVPTSRGWAAAAAGASPSAVSASAGAAGRASASARPSSVGARPSSTGAEAHTARVQPEIVSPVQPVVVPVEDVPDSWEDDV